MDQSVCEPCPVGTKTPAEEHPVHGGCDPCERGQFQDETGQASCKSCPAGQYQDLSGSTRCQECLPGTFTSTEGNVECTPAALGYYVPTPGMTHQIPCPSSYGTDVLGSKDCISLGLIHCLGIENCVTDANNLTRCGDATLYYNTVAAACMTCPVGKIANDLKLGCIDPPEPTPHPTPLPTPAPTTLAPTMTSPDEILKCVDTRLRDSYGWSPRGVFQTIRDARVACAGYTRMSLECPTSAGFEVFCGSESMMNAAPTLAVQECEGLPSNPNIHGGSNIHCVGPYFLTEDSMLYALGGANRGAVYRVDPSILKCVDTRLRDSYGWSPRGVFQTIRDARVACAGYTRMSLECPTSAGFEVFCGSESMMNAAPTLAVQECEGLPSNPNIHGGSNIHCVGPYFLAEDSVLYALGGANRGAVLRT
eukprot:jgi/Bigna1/56362/estExt_Genewise1Plus.C_960019